MLEDFLEDFPGAVIVVSHDRAFLERTVDDVVVFDGSGSVGRRPGGYEAYEAFRREQRTSGASSKVQGEPAAQTETSAKAKAGRSKSTLRHLLKQNEKETAALERRRTELSDELAAAGDDHDALARIGTELGEMSASIEQLEEAWLELSEELEG